MTPQRSATPTATRQDIVDTVYEACVEILQADGVPSRDHQQVPGRDWVQVQEGDHHPV